MKPIRLSYKSRSLAFTSMGTRFIILMILIGAAAINTGNNLLYMILAMMLSLMLVSGILSETCLNRLRYRRLAPLLIYAGEPVSIKLVVYNDKTVVPSFSLHVADSLEACLGGPVRDKYFFKLPPSALQERSYSVLFRRRGVYRPKGVSFSTRFPFGVFLKTRTEAETEEAGILVFPRVFRVSPPGKERALTGPSATLKKGPGNSLYQFRPYISGDDARAIHWKTSARKNKLMVREYEEEDEKKVIVGISNRVLNPPSKESLERFEKGIELAASYCRYYLEEGYWVSFFDGETLLSGGTGMHQLKEILTILATLDVCYDKEKPERRGEDLSTPAILISPFYPVQTGRYSKVFRPDDIDRLPYWNPA
ncbi:MAG: DUF58 domain-containing protein [Nitrospirae bacterium]|nr:DUF58 domain-containing protein [Nitrospirota bacterium]